MVADFRMGQGVARKIGQVTLALATVLVVQPVFASSQAFVERATGLARFELAAGRPERALARISELQSEDASWLQARALMATGQTGKASSLLELQLEGQSHRGDAALALGRLALTEKDAAGARRYFDAAARLGHGETRQQALYEVAAMELGAGHADRAGQILARMEPGYWAALGYMNLAAAYSDRDLNAARPLVALRVALAMSDHDAASDRGQALRSQLLVRAGYLSYHQEDYEKAISFLEQVALDSYHTPRALYLHGLALAARDNHRAAMQSWHRAKKYPLAYPGVEDAWLGMGRGYDLSGYLGQAGEAYLAANASYESERVTLRKLASRIREQGAWKALIEDARGSDAQWFLADSRTLTQPRMAYLLRFMEDPTAQHSVSRVAELAKLDATLLQQEHNLRVFQASLQARLATASGDTGNARQPLQAKAEQLRLAAQALKDRAMAPAQLQEIAAALDALTDVESALTSLPQRMARRDKRILELARRADSALASAISYRSRAAELRKRAESRLDEVALAFVERQDERMVSALDKTEQQIAHLYEYLALESLEREGD